MPKSESQSLKGLSITKLVSMLDEESDQKEKRRIRSKLRALGHFGGTGSGRGRKPSDKTKKAAGKNKVKKAKPKKAKPSEAAEEAAA